MKRAIITFTSLLAVLGFAILTMVPKAQLVSAAVTMAAAAPAGSAAPAPMNHCPNIHHAIEALQSAMNDMSKADHNYCGNKREAMEAAGHALAALRRAEECDRCR
ncbi:MAG: hypothetical protein ABSG32_14580 [Terriglobia bacterium]|jgi:hypothetical protein